MSITDYIKKLNKLKTLAVNRFGVLTVLEGAVMEASYDWLLDNLDIKRGVPQVDEQLARIMDEFVGAVMDIVRGNKAFTSPIGSFLADLDLIQKNNAIFHITTNNFNINTAGVNEVQKAVIAEVLNQFQGNGLNAHFVAPLRDGIFRNILAGANLREVKAAMQNYILGGQDQSGKLHQYLNQTAAMAVDTYTGAINQQLVKEFDFTGYLISGSIIATSSKQCETAIKTSEGGYLTFKAWEAILAMAAANKKAPLIPGTDLKNLPLNKLHWGCRHDFTPVIM